MTPHPKLSAFLLSMAVLLLSGCSKGGSGTPTANVSQLRQELKSTEAQVRQNACTDAAQLGAGAKAALPELIPLLQDSDPLTRRLAAYAIGQIGPEAKAAIPELKKLFTDPDMAVMTSAINAVSNIDPKESGGAKIVNVTQ